MNSAPSCALMQNHYIFLERSVVIVSSLIVSVAASAAVGFVTSQVGQYCLQQGMGYEPYLDSKGVLAQVMTVTSLHMFQVIMNCYKLSQVVDSMPTTCSNRNVAVARVVFVLVPVLLLTNLFFTVLFNRSIRSIQDSMLTFGCGILALWIPTILCFSVIFKLCSLLIARQNSQAAPNANDASVLQLPGIQMHRSVLEPLLASFQEESSTIGNVNYESAGHLKSSYPRSFVCHVFANPIPADPATYYADCDQPINGAPAYIRQTYSH